MSQCFPPVSPEHGLEFRVQGLGFSHVKVISTCPPAPARAHTHTFTCRSTGIGVSCGVCRVVSMRMRGQCVCLYISLYISLYYVMLEAAATRPVVELVFLYICLSLSVCLSVCLSAPNTYTPIDLSVIYLLSICL